MMRVQGGSLMMRFLGVVALLVLLELMTMPALAAELHVRGFFENIFPHVDSNTSDQDFDMTRNSDQIFFGRERARLFFDFSASDNLRGVLALEVDSTYGAPPFNRVGSRCILGDGLYAFEQCGFRNGIDNNAIELKNLFIDFLIPQLPIGNRLQLGGIPANVTPLHSYLLYTMDAGGGSLKLDFSDQVSLLLHYIQLEEDLDRFRGSAKLGEDYIAGMTLMLKPISGLDVHLLGVFGHLQAPFGPFLQIGAGPFNGIIGDATNVTTEDRYYFGVDARYRFGNLSIEPSFIYLLGTRKFCTPGSLTNTNGVVIPCRSSQDGFGEIAFNAFETQLALQYTRGSWLWAGKFAYTSGNAADDDINQTGIGNTSDVQGFRPLGIDGYHAFGEWFEIFGRSDVDSVGAVTFIRPGKQGTFNSFGWMVLGAKAEYLATNRLVLEGSVGGFWTAEKTACPAVFRVGTVTGPCAVPPLDFTGNSRYVGTEIDIGLRYTILPGLIWTPRAGWAFLGDAWQIQNRNVQDAWTFVNRVIYVF
jgi:hypothetical protein